MADPWADFSPVNPSGMLSAGNIDLTNRPRVKNADGSISTVRSIGVNFDGKEYLIPTVTDDGRVVSEDEAVKLFKRTGKHLGVFDSPAASTAYAKSLHNDQAAMLEKDPWADFSPVKEEAAPETPFPTTSETMGRMFKSGLTAIPGMVSGMVEGATAPIMAIPNEVKAYAQGKPSPTMEQIRGVAGHLGAAFAPGPAGAAERMGEAVQAVPVAGPLAAQVVKGGKEILTPAYKSGILDPLLAFGGMTPTEPGRGVGTVTPEQMNTAADTGGAAIANIAAPEIARGGVAVAGKITPSMGKLLKFGPPAAMAVAGHPVAAVKMLMKGALTEHVLKPMGNIAIDHVLERIAARDAEGAAAALARGLEKSPEAAKALASTLEQQANKVAPPGGPAFRPIGNSPADVAARNAAKRARLGRPPADAPIVAPAANADPWNGLTTETPEVLAAREAGKAHDWSGWSPQGLKRPAFVDEAQGVNLPPDTSMPQGYPRGGRSNPGPWEPVDPIPDVPKTPVQPVKGNVKLPTVYTKPGPKVKPAAGESPTAKALAEKQGKVASPDAIRAAFGETPKGPTTQTERIKSLADRQRALVSEQAIRDAFEGAAEPGPVKFHDDPAIDAKIKETLPIIADALRKGKGTPSGFVETGNHSGDLKPYGPTDTGVKAALGLDDMPQSRKAIAAAIKKDKGNPIERAVAKRVATQIEEMADDAAPFSVEPDIPHAKKGPNGAPLTAAERKAALIKLQQAIAGEQDIFASFGMEN